MTKIPLEDYKKILENMPICCVDLVIHHQGKVLLVYRKDEPAKNQWWLPGGRILKHETLQQAALRKAKEETGFDIEIEKQIGTYELTFKEAPFGVKTGVHSICIDFLGRPKDKNFKIKLDQTSTDYKWMDSIEKDLHPYVKQLLKDSGVFK